MELFHNQKNAGVVLAFFLAITSHGAPTGPDFEPIPVWYKSLSLHGGFGYKDNVLLSNFAPRPSAFWSTGFDFLLWRLPTGGWQFNFFVTGDDLRYVKSVGVDAEQMAVGMAQMSRDFGHDWKATLPLQYVYMNQVFDLSATEKTNVIGKVLGHHLSLRPSLKKSFGDDWIEWEMEGTRQYFAQPLDDFSQVGAKISLGRNYGRGSSITLAYQTARVFYDTREGASRTGADLAGTSLRFQNHVVELALDHRWDKKKRWSTLTRLGFELDRDNGSGFYDYSHYRVSQQIGYHADTWQVTAQMKAGFYDYSIQTASATDPSLRRKTGITFNLHAEKNLGKQLKIFANFDRDRSQSNLAFDNYAANTVSTGFEWEF